MADGAISITPGSGANIDTRTESTNNQHRQVIVIGDPSDNNGVAGVDGTNGLNVTLTTAIPSGTNAIGKLAANSGVDIGDVDIASIAAGDNNIGNVDVITLPAVTIAGSQTLSTVTTVNTVTTLTNGGIAHDSADSGNPHKLGAYATASLSNQTNVSAADRTDLKAGVDGVLIVRPNTNLEDTISGNASNTDGASTEVIAAAGTNIKVYITDITLSNTSASNIYVELKNGTTTKWTFPLPANGGVTHSFTTPIGGTANTAWNFDSSAATSTVYCSAAGFKSKV